MILNTGLAHNLQPILNALRKGGVLLQVGLPDASKPLSFEHMATVTSQKSIVGGYIGNRGGIEEMRAFFHHSLVRFRELLKREHLHYRVYIVQFREFQHFFDPTPIADIASHD